MGVDAENVINMRNTPETEDEENALIINYMMFILGIEIGFKNQVYPVVINVGSIPELLVTEIDSRGVTFGASLTLSKISEILKQEIEPSPSKCFHSNAHF